MGSRRTRSDRRKPQHLIRRNPIKKDMELAFKYDYFLKKEVCYYGSNH